jgi:hypothetical protein
MAAPLSPNSCASRGYVKGQPKRYIQGHNKPREQDYTGQTFGELTVVERIGKSKGGEGLLLCKCSCGEQTPVQVGNLTSGHTKSCGHLWDKWVAEKVFKHGHTNTPLYETWAGIKQRCYNPKASGYAWYGGQGIELDPMWHDFQAFEAYVLATIGPRPEGQTASGYAEYTIDRWPCEGTKNYAPGNIRWANKRQQTSNQERFSTDSELSKAA